MSTETGSRLSGDALEARLLRLYEIPVPSIVATEIDRRTAIAISAQPSHGGPFGTIRRRRAVLAMVAAVVVATVAATPVIRFFEGWDESFDRVFEMSTVIDQSVTEDGYRVTVVRAYGDPSSLRLAITAEDLGDRGWAEINVTGASVTDEKGRIYRPLMGSFQQPSPETSESWLRFEVPVGAADGAERRLAVHVEGIDVRPSPAPTLADGTIDLDHIWTSVSGDWSFEFDLTFFGAQTARPALTATSAGITVSLDELTVTPAATVGRISIAGLPPVDPGWAWDPYMRITHDGRPVTVMMLAPGSVQDRLTFEAEPGFEDLSGVWVITIDEFHRDVPDPTSDITTESVSLKGPWVLTFEGPPPGDAPSAIPS